MLIFAWRFLLFDISNIMLHCRMNGVATKFIVSIAAITLSFSSNLFSVLHIDKMLSRQDANKGCVIFIIMLIKQKFSKIHVYIYVCMCAIYEYGLRIGITNSRLEWITRASSSALHRLWNHYNDLGSINALRIGRSGILRLNHDAVYDHGSAKKNINITIPNIMCFFCT